jgi:hypothetical protein
MSKSDFCHFRRSHRGHWACVRPIDIADFQSARVWSRQLQRRGSVQNPTHCAANSFTPKRRLPIERRAIRHSPTTGACVNLLPRLACRPWLGPVHAQHFRPRLRASIQSSA